MGLNVQYSPPKRRVVNEKRGKGKEDIENEDGREREWKEGRGLTMNLFWCSLVDKNEWGMGKLRKKRRRGRRERWEEKGEEKVWLDGLRGAVKTVGDEPVKLSYQKFQWYVTKIHWSPFTLPLFSFRSSLPLFHLTWLNLTFSSLFSFLLSPSEFGFYIPRSTYIPL